MFGVAIDHSMLYIALGIWSFGVQTLAIFSTSLMFQCRAVFSSEAPCFAGLASYFPEKVSTCCLFTSVFKLESMGMGRKTICSIYSTYPMNLNG